MLDEDCWVTVLLQKRDNDVDIYPANDAEAVEAVEVAAGPVDTAGTVDWSWLPAVCVGVCSGGGGGGGAIRPGMLVGRSARSTGAALDTWVET